MQPLVIGVNHRTAPIELRERVAFSQLENKEAVLQLTASGLLSEAVIVSTCNRSEVYGVGSGKTDVVPAVQSFVCRFHQVDRQQIDGCFYHYTDAEAVRHLFRVAASLDAMVLGEPHILGQVRDAFLLALRGGTTGIVLNHLFQKAAQVGKRVRTETEIGLRPVSVSAVAVELATKIFGRLHECAALVLGAGETSELTVESLASRGVKRIAVTNRSRVRAEALAERCGGSAISWESFADHLGGQDIVISSVQTQEWIARRELIERIMVERRDRPLLLIDLGLPRNIEPQVQEVYNVFLYNLDDLQGVADENRREREKHLPKADKIINQEVQQFMRWQQSLSVVPTVKSLRRKVDRIRENELEAHLRKLEHLTEHERNIITGMTHAIVNKILHEPTVRLKQSTEERHLEAIRYLFDLEGEE